MPEIPTVVLHGIMFRAGWRAAKSRVDNRGNDITPNDTLHSAVAELHRELRDAGWEIAPALRGPKA